MSAGRGSAAEGHVASACSKRMGRIDGDCVGLSPMPVSPRSAAPHSSKSGMSTIDNPKLVDVRIGRDRPPVGEPKHCPYQPNACRSIGRADEHSLRASHWTGNTGRDACVPHQAKSAAAAVTVTVSDAAAGLRPPAGLSAGMQSR